VTDGGEIAAYLVERGIDYERLDATAVPAILVRGVACSLPRSRCAEGAWRMSRPTSRRFRGDAGTRRDAQTIQQRALARRGRSSLIAEGRGIFHIHPETVRCSRSRWRPAI
jgi:hypothetical protein